MGPRQQPVLAECGTTRVANLAQVTLIDRGPSPNDMLGACHHEAPHRLPYAGRMRNSGLTAAASKQPSDRADSLAIVRKGEARHLACGVRLPRDRERKEEEQQSKRGSVREVARARNRPRRTMRDGG